MLRVLPVIAAHILLNMLRPELCESITHPTEPTKTTPRKSPSTRANPTATRARAGLEVCGLSESGSMQQGYHSTRGDHTIRVSAVEITASPYESRCRFCGTALRPSFD